MTHRTVAVKTALSLASAVAVAAPLASTAAAAHAAPGRSSTPTTIVVRDDRSGHDVTVLSKKHIRDSALPARSIDVKRVAYTIDRANGLFRVYIKATNLAPVLHKHGYAMRQYATVNVQVGHNRDRAFGLGSDNKFPNQAQGYGDPGSQSPACGKALRHATTHVNFKTDVIHMNIGLACLPVGKPITLDATDETWVNPKNPPNTEVAVDYVKSVTFTRHN